VVSRNVEIGQTVEVGIGPPLFLFAADLTVIQVDANVSENDIGEIKLGDKASFTVESFSKSHFAGEVTQIGLSPQTTQNIVTYDVVITVSNPDLLLEPGMTAIVRIVINGRNNVLKAPNQAL
jgi:HlyD family secretion protein